MWRKFGPDCLDKLRGMYAFLIYSKSEQKIFFGRDPLGIKPLFFTERNGEIIISSETKVLREVVSSDFNTRDLELLMFGSTGDQRTGIKNFRRCLPGKLYIFDLNTRN